MKVILIKPVRKLGKIGDVVKVRDGFGRNFLLSQGFAVRATESNMRMIDDKKHELEAKNAEEKVSAEALAVKISGLDVTFIMQAAADKRLFGSVSNKEIAKAIAGLGYAVSHSQVSLENPIKSLGIFEVSLNLHTDVTCQVVVNIARSESEAGDALRDYKQAKEQILVQPSMILDTEAISTTQSVE
jgi:large subunit ribosomal protein L9